MRYLLSINGSEREVDVQVTPEGEAIVAVDGVRVAADVVRIPGGVSLILDGRVYDVVAGGPNTGRQVAAGERRAIVGVESERERARRERKGGAGKGDKELRAPMPGRVVKLLVAVGDEVAADQPLVVIEAMKMENELRSTAAGKVKSVDVTEGQNVESDTLLVALE